MTQSEKNKRRQTRERLARLILQAQYEQETGQQITKGVATVEFDEWLRKKYDLIVNEPAPE